MYIINGGVEAEAAASFYLIYKSFLLLTHFVNSEIFLGF